MPKRNGVSEKVRSIYGDLTKGLNEKEDIVVANLMADLVVMLTADVAAHLKGKSIYISSGILLEKKEMVAAAIEEKGFQNPGYLRRRGMVCYCGTVSKLYLIRRLLGVFS